MEDEIKVGEYVRTKDGTFDKIIDIKDTLGERKLVCFEKSNSYSSDISLKNMEVKHSKNIIDLIEEGDYVNGNEVLWVNEKIVHCEARDTIDYMTEDIKSIVTKEMFASMEYKIKE